MSKGTVNKLIDLAFHPYFKYSKAVIVLDGCAHALNERDLPLSLLKFARYNLPYLLKEEKK
jgi:hypothetical protein